MEKITQHSISDKDVMLFNAAKPFKHIIIDDFLQPEVVKEIARDFPKPEEEIWYEYNNVLEKKLASDDIRKFPPSIAMAIAALNHQSFIDELEKLTGIKGLIADPYLHGGGMHCITSGGKLDMHIDYAIHPKLGLERRINLILYLVDEDWNQDWGGELQLWDGEWKDGTPELDHKVVSVFPKFNRAVIFEVGDDSFHGHPDPLTCPEGTYRRSIALYYLSEPQEGVTNRTRARFIARHGQDAEDEETQKFRDARSSVKGVYNK